MPIDFKGRWERAATLMETHGIDASRRGVVRARSLARSGWTVISRKYGSSRGGEKWADFLQNCPKSTCLRHVTQADCDRIVSALNSRPRNGTATKLPSRSALGPEQRCTC